MKRLALAAVLLAPPALAQDADPSASPAPTPTASPARSGPDGDLLYRITLAPDAFLNYIQLTPGERKKYVFYSRHMNETQKLEYLRRMKSEDREKYARDIGLPKLEDVPEKMQESIVSGQVDLGMTREQVKLALGEPAGKALGAGNLFGRSYKSWERWTYQRPGGPYAVWFSGDKVVAYGPATADAP